MRRKIFSLTLCVSIICSVFGVLSVAARFVSQDENWNYILRNDNEVIIREYYGDENEIVIPDSIDGYTVTGIETAAFVGNAVSISIPASVATIEPGAFSGCLGLMTIEVSSGNPNYCSEGGILFNKNKTAIVAMPARYGEYEYTIPETVTKICSYCFEGTNIDFINIGASVTDIEEGAFAYNSLREINVDSQNSKYKSQGGILYDKDMTTIMAVPADKNIESYVAPDSAKTVAAAAFSGNRCIKDISIPMVENIEFSAFSGSTELVSINMSENLKNIGERAFASCTSIERIIIPEGVEDIGGGAFWNCSSLIGVHFPLSLTSIGEEIFHRNNALDDIYYAGNSAQWEGISIGEYNEIFDEVTIHYNHIPDRIIVSDATIGNDGVFRCSLDVGLEVSVDDAVAIVALYDQNDLIVAAKPLTFDVDARVAELSIPVGDDEYSSYKLFIWDKQMRPLA